MGFLNLNSVDVTSYNPSTGAFQSNITFLNGFLTDGNGADNMFDTSESLTADFTAAPANRTWPATYDGTVSISGIDYPLFSFAGETYVVGIRLDSSVYPNLASLGTVDPSDLPVAFCFAAGTLIATPDGARVVEDFKIGDPVLAADGHTVPVKWLGRQTLHKWRHGPHMQPVRIRTGALGDGLPHADLTVTADHGMVLDGYVINASALVNGDTIDFVPMDKLDDSFTVYHVETEHHDVILANGAPAETFIDVAGRRAFDNYQEYLDLYGQERIIAPLPQPRISSARLLPAEIRSRLGARMALPAASVG